MKKFFLAALAAMALASCSTKEAGVWTELSGEWNVVAIDGNQIKIVDTLMQQPFIGFSPADSSLYGCASCNRIIGSLSISEDPTKADFSKVGSTMMMCPDMSVEDAFMSAIKTVTSYYEVEAGKIEFVDSEGNSKMLLEKR